eukprot:scaffold195779_cov33-Cyclotella_meneghiniana.AAC.2
MIKSFKKNDAPPNRVKPVPLRVIRHIAFLAQHSLNSSSHIVATSDMIILAFFFLLRPGEYSDTDSRDSDPFRLCDVQLFIGDRRLDLFRDSEALLLQSRFASLTFTTQKNGIEGEVIGLACSGDPYVCPVKSIGVSCIFETTAHPQPRL